MNYRLKLLIFPALVCILLGCVSLHAARTQQQPGPGGKAPAKLDLNSAAEGELMHLPDMTFPLVRKIIANRPYTNTHELVSKGLISEDTYSRIRDLITVKPPAPRRFALPPS